MTRFLVGMIVAALGRKAQRMRECLEHEVTIFRPIAMPAQRCQRERMRRVVRKIEAAFQGKSLGCGVVEPRKPGTNERVQLRLRRSLTFELTAAHEVIEIPERHRRTRSE